MKFYGIICLLLIYGFPLKAEQTTGSYGMELDALPWLTGGYYVSGWYGLDHLKYRAVTAQINVPSSFVKAGFKDHEITVYALILDYFPNKNFKGIWYGAGLEYWQSSITNESNNINKEFGHTVFTAGLGYVWHISDALYLNPWAALHMLISGEEKISVGNRTYQQDTIVPSASIKLGWNF